MRCRSLILTLVAGLAFAAPLVFAQQFSSVEERMSSADFKAAGLQKLTPEELSRLNAFIKSEVEKRTVQAREEVVHEQDMSASERMGFKNYEGEREEITSKIPGDFKGWTTGTTITLENGQVWRVWEADAEFVIRVSNPVVHITPGLLGNWNLHVEGYGTTAKVERIK
jgi:hypothetical protein